MIIFLYGPDTYRSRQKLNEIIEHYKKVHKGGLNLKFFEERKEDFQVFQNEFGQMPMFKGKKLAVLKNIFQNPAFKSSFLENFKKSVSSNDIILFREEGIPSRSDPLFKFLARNAKVQEFQLLSGQKLRNWIKNEAERQGVEIDSRAIDKLIVFVGSDLWRLSNEIKKITTFAKNPAGISKKIETKDVELLVRPKIEADIFETIEAMAAKDKKRTLFLLRRHLDKGDSCTYLLHMINFQFRNLLIIKDMIDKNNPYNIIFKKSGFHPYVFKKSYWQAKKFSTRELKKIYQKLFRIDLDIKTGRLEPETALDLLIAEI